MPVQAVKQKAHNDFDLWPGFEEALKRIEEKQRQCLFNTKLNSHNRCRNRVGKTRVSDEVLKELRGILEELNEYSGGDREHFDRNIKRLGEIVGCGRHNTRPSEKRVGRREAQEPSKITTRRDTSDFVRGLRADFDKTIRVLQEGLGESADNRNANEGSDDGRVADSRETRREMQEEDPERQESIATAGTMLSMAEQFQSRELAARQNPNQDRQLRTQTVSRRPVRAHSSSGPSLPWKPHNRNRLTKKDLKTLLLEAASKEFRPESRTKAKGADPHIRPVEGFVYAYNGYKQDKYIKIGYTTEENVEVYIRRSRRVCDQPDGSFNILHKSKKVINPHRVEQMIHEELFLKRYQYVACPCPAIHREWFEVDEKTATEAIDRWQKWMHENDPYEMRIENGITKWYLRSTAQTALARVIAEAEEIAKQAVVSLATVATEIAPRTARDIAASTHEHGLTEVAARDDVAADTHHVGILGTALLTDSFEISEEPDSMPDGTSIIPHPHGAARSAQRSPSILLPIPGNYVETAPSSPTATSSVATPFNEGDSIFDNSAVSIDTEQTEISPMVQPERRAQPEHETPVRPGPTPLQVPPDESPGSVQQRFKKWLSGIVWGLPPPASTPASTP